jgi:hypothetical protein
MEDMDLVRVTPACTTGMCPTIYVTSRGTAVVQGVLCPVAGQPTGVTFVEIPGELLRELDLESLRG